MPMNTSYIQPYLFFGGRCEEALEFYRTAIGAQVDTILRHKESPTPPPAGTLPPGFEDKVMHATFRVGKTALMASDGCEVGPKFAGFSLALGVATEGDADRVFAALSEGGSVTMPLTQTFWSPRFGMLTDRFGIGWMVSVEAEAKP